MKNACRNFVPLHKLRRRLTKKNITSLLILLAIASALFITPTIAFARSNARDSGQLPTVGVIPTPTPTPKPSNRPSNPTVPPIAPLASIRMLDQTHGWALTQSAILNTTDGGLHWQNVTPANANLSDWSQGDFLNAQNAWIVTPQGEQKSISTLHTTDGGKSWTQLPPTPLLISDLSFVDANNGWAIVSTETIPDDINTQRIQLLHTTNGGRTWQPINDSIAGQSTTRHVSKRGDSA